MSTIELQSLLEAGVHFGHQTRKWNPRMKPFIFSKRGGFHIVDLGKTKEQLEEAAKFLKEAVDSGKVIVFVGTKRQAAPIIADEARRAGVYFVNHRWIGGLITNFESVLKVINDYDNLQQKLEDKSFGKLTTRDKFRLKKDVARLGKLIGGLRGIKKAPELLVVVDPSREKAAVHEAEITQTPTIAILDTNSDPYHITIPIPGNDDSLKSITALLKVLTDAIVEGRGKAVGKET